MIMNILANIHPGQKEFYFISIINYINYCNGRVQGFQPKPPA